MPVPGEQAPIVEDVIKPSAPVQEAGISGAPPPPAQRVLSREQRVEYRDQDGNILNEEQVKALEGKVEFKTRYETRTRVIDDKGNELPVPIDESLAGKEAPPHPGAEDVDEKTAKKGDGKIPPAKKSVEDESEARAKSAKPASEKKEASAHS